MHAVVNSLPPYHRFRPGAPPVTRRRLPSLSARIAQVKSKSSSSDANEAEGKPVVEEEPNKGAEDEESQDSVDATKPKKPNRHERLRFRYLNRRQKATAKTEKGGEPEQSEVKSSRSEKATPRAIRFRTRLNRVRDSERTTKKPFRRLHGPQEQDKKKDTVNTPRPFRLSLRRKRPIQSNFKQVEETEMLIATTVAPANAESER